MNFNIDDLKKKIIYRSNYRGTKEMDTLLSSFVNEVIDQLSHEDLVKLLILLDIDDDNLYKLNRGIKTNISIEENKISNLLKKYELKKI